MTDLFGNPVFGRPVGRKLPGRQQCFGQGAEWIDAARDWCAAQAIELERIEAGGRFRAAGVWHRIGFGADDWVVEIEGSDDDGLGNPRL